MDACYGHFLYSIIDVTLLLTPAPRAWRWAGRINPLPAAEVFIANANGQLMRISIFQQRQSIFARVVPNSRGYRRRQSPPPDWLHASGVRPRPELRWQSNSPLLDQTSLIQQIAQIFAGLGFRLAPGKLSPTPQRRAK